MDVKLDTPLIWAYESNRVHNITLLLKFSFDKLSGLNTKIDELSGLNTEFDELSGLNTEILGP